MTEHNADLAVMGGGIAGMIAAVRAATAGRRVIVLERGRDDRYLCNSRVTGGVFHICLKDIHSDEGELERAIMDVSGGTARPDLAQAVARDGKRVVKWLAGHGTRFMRASPEPFHNVALAPPALVRVGLQFEGRAGDVLLRNLESILVRHGGIVLRGHTAERLIGGPGGACAGVEGQADGGPFVVTARHTLVADGGFQLDLDRVRDNITPDPAKVLQRSARSGLGHGLRMAVAFGAATTRLDGFYGHVMARAAIGDDRLWPYPWLDDILATAVIVGADGRRFVDEGGGGVYVANRIAALPDPLSTTVIFDGAMWDAASKARALPPNPNLEKNGGTVVRGATFEELGRKLGLPEGVLAAELDAYNEAVRRGTLAALALPRSEERGRALPIVKPPFLAAPACAGMTYTMGGIAIDAACRVLSPGGAPVEGLLAAGTTTGGLEGGDRAGYVGGLVKSAVTGLRAAEHVLGELRD